MGKKMKLPFFSKKKEARKKNTWLCTSCKQPKTISFRAGDYVFQRVNSLVFVELTSNGVETPKSLFTNSAQSASFSTTELEDQDSKLGSTDDLVIRRAHSDRLFFEAGLTRSILKEEKSSGNLLKECEVLTMESQDPYEDFKRSMEEMVESHGLNGWDWLEELLLLYMRLNGRGNHGFIVGAFVDLLVALAASSSPLPPSNSGSAVSTSFSSVDTSFSYPRLLMKTTQ